jgi:hypothetical protein
MIPRFSDVAPVGRLVAVLAVGAAFGCGVFAAVRAEEPAAGFVAFLAERGIDREQRRVLEQGGGWTDEQQKAVIRVLARLNAPPALALPWQEQAEPLRAGAPEVGDRLLRVRGRATFVAPQRLTEEQEQLAGQPTFDVVRIVAEGGEAVDVVTHHAPKTWPRWRPIDEPAGVVGLPLSTVASPRPGPPLADAAEWPAVSPAVLLAATGISWQPPTPLGGLGMDYGLFETVTDGRRLEAGDAAAFYALLTAVGRAQAGQIEAAAGKPADIVPIIDPTQKWFASHRGEPVTIDGIARRATRISIDEPFRRAQVGTDHYWELFVFVDTPLLQVNGRQQSDYPIVCCVRSLPEGFPTGDSISERVRVSGFAFKRYGYALPNVEISSPQGDRESKDERMETALVVGRTAVWKPAPSTARTTGVLSWIFSTLAAIVGLALAYGLWSMRRDARSSARRARSELPDRIDLPGGRG